MSTNFVLVLNCGSSSLKFAILNPVNGGQYLSGLAECFHLPDSRITWKINNNIQKVFLGANSAHNEAMLFIVTNILKKELKLIEKIFAIGHRVVHGGEKLTKSVIIDDKIIQYIKDAICFAPLHNPAHLIGIKAAMKYFPHLATKNVAVFDTAFHQTIPEYAFLYALPYHLYKQQGIRRYGAHGISHYYVSRETAKILKISINQLNIITCHLGNGSSVAAIRNGICVDTSMGLTPLEGLVMGTRSGDIDPAIIFFLNQKVGMSINSINKLLTQQSGLLGLSGISSDCRYIEQNYNKNAEAKLALDVFCHRLAKYISAYSSLMNGRLDAIVFTGGIGENSTLVRELTIKKLSLLNITIDINSNLKIVGGKYGLINKKSTIPVLVIPTNEELVIAKDAARVVSS